MGFDKQYNEIYGEVKDRKVLGLLSYIYKRLETMESNGRSVHRNINTRCLIEGIMANFGKYELGTQSVERFVENDDPTNPIYAEGLLKIVSNARDYFDIKF